jgi:hypothetical protein
MPFEKSSQSTGRAVTHRHSPRLISAHDLAVFHAERARLYGATADVIRATPTPSMFDQVRAYLEGVVDGRSHRAIRELQGAFTDASVDEAAGELAALRRGGQSFDCPDAGSSARNLACAAAEIRAAPDYATELSALSILAERTSRTLSAGALSAAAAAQEAQMNFLRDHADSCLCALAHALERTPYRVYSRVGRALGFALEDDRLLLGPPNAGAAS